jgi:two-component system sensor histidine kinase UhpB
MKLQNDRLNEQLTNVQEEERADLARELHDEIGPFLFAVSLDVSAIHQIAKDDVASQLAPRMEAIRDAERVCNGTEAREWGMARR